MPNSLNTSIQSIIDDAIKDVVTSVSGAIERAVAERLAQGLKTRPVVSAKGRRARRGGGRQPRGEITKWVPDRRARRVPTFVIEMTGGLDTKKKIVEKYGAKVVFEKGKPLPK